MLLVTLLSDDIPMLLVKGVLLLFLLEDELVVMGVSSLCREVIIDNFVVSLGYLLGIMEVIEILGVLELEGINAELENIGDFLDVIPGPSPEITPGTSI